jgi:hypothetical protein
MYWKQRGIVSLWRYTENTRNYPGWHLTADAAGVASLLDLCSRLGGGVEGTGARTVSISRPSTEVLSVSNNKNACAKWIAPPKWRIQYAPDTEDAWSFSVAGPATVLVGSLYLPRLMGGLAAIASRKGDYSIGGDDVTEHLWFWWWPQATEGARGARGRTRG